MNGKRKGLLFEFFALYGVLPIAFRLGVIPIYPLLALWGLTGLCLWILLHDAHFHRRLLWQTGLGRHDIVGIAVRFAFTVTVLGLYVYFFTPHLLFIFPREKPRLYIIVMILYPLVSVYPQGVIYRLFLFHRYDHFFSGYWGPLLASAAAFSFMHIVLRNPVAPALTLVGGILFAKTYKDTGSLVISAIEHALYGNFIFTIGLGRYFLMGILEP